MLRETPRIIRLSGDYDVYTTPQLESQIKTGEGSRHVVLDFGAVQYIDSTAIAALVRMETRRNEKGLPAVRFASLSADLRHILKVTALDDAWLCYEDLEHAVASFD